MRNGDVVGWLIKGTGCFYLALELIAICLCFRYRHLSRRLVIVGIGYACGVVASGFNLLLFFLPGLFREIRFESLYTLYTLFTYVLGVVENGLVVVGLFLTLADLHKRLSAPPQAQADPSRTSDDPEHWRPQRPGSQQIHE